MGMVTSSPAGINCNSDCSKRFPSGTGVTLVAAPAAEVSFAGWSGACSGSGACALTLATGTKVKAVFRRLNTTPVVTQDTIPDPFGFPPRTDAIPGSLVVSDSIVVTGINAAAPIFVVGGEYAIDAGDWTSAPGSVRARQTVRLRLLARGYPGETASATLNIGGVAAEFAVTTKFTPVVSANHVFLNPQNSTVSNGIVLVTAVPQTSFEINPAAPVDAVVKIATSDDIPIASGSQTLFYKNVAGEEPAVLQVKEFSGANGLQLAAGTVSITATAGGVTVPAMATAATNAVLVTQSDTTQMKATRDANRSTLTIAIESGDAVFLQSGSTRAVSSGSIPVYAGESAEILDTGFLRRIRLGSLNLNNGLPGDYLSGMHPTANKLRVPNISGKTRRFAENLDTLFARAVGNYYGLTGATATQDKTSGIVTLVCNEGTYRGFPLGAMEIDIPNRRALAATDVSVNLESIVAEGLSFAIAPATSYAELSDQIKAIDPTGHIEILEDGVLLAQFAGAYYVTQPDFELLPGGDKSPGFEEMDKQLVLRDKDGNRQILYPAFANIAHLLETFDAPANHYQVARAGKGKYLLSTSKSPTAITLLPDSQLTATVSAAEAALPWWRNGDKIMFHYPNGMGHGFTVQ